MPRAIRLLASRAHLGAWAVLCAAAAGCLDRESAQRAVESLSSSGVRPDEMPVMLNREPPFRYPQSLWSSRVQGNVTLRIFIDTAGAVRAESTSVWESSGYPAFDSAAVKGSGDLAFRPAKLRGQPLAISILLPVFFRHPESAPLPGDTVLRSPRPGNP